MSCEISNNYSEYSVSAIPGLSTLPETPGLKISLLNLPDKHKTIKCIYLIFSYLNSISPQWKPESLDFWPKACRALFVFHIVNKIADIITTSRLKTAWG